MMPRNLIKKYSELYNDLSDDYKLRISPSDYLASIITKTAVWRKAMDAIDFYDKIENELKLKTQNNNNLASNNRNNKNSNYNGSSNYINQGSYNNNDHNNSNFNKKYKVSLCKFCHEKDIQSPTMNNNFNNLNPNFNEFNNFSSNNFNNFNPGNNNFNLDNQNWNGNNNRNNNHRNNNKRNKFNGFIYLNNQKFNNPNFNNQPFHNPNFNNNPNFVLIIFVNSNINEENSVEASTPIRKSKSNTAKKNTIKTDEKHPEIDNQTDFEVEISHRKIIKPHVRKRSTDKNFNNSINNNYENTFIDNSNINFL
ncbi:hypothetical protein H8356DRAFT_1436271 [Neocallimastix lanati (nom. inval.)]|nr:hypothetical protein H8356DRAFT_1436271 [Neocallimastix sp. JGI-2020a]